MNKDQIKGSVKDAVGQVQEKAGKLIGSTEQTVKGLHKQVEGKTQKSQGDLKEEIHDAQRK